MSRLAILMLVAAFATASSGWQNRASVSSRTHVESAAITTAQHWTAAHFDTTPSALPFSFVYAGKSSSDLLKSWTMEQSAATLDSYRQQKTIIMTDPATHLELRCVMVQYKDFPTVEWTIYLKNKGNSATPVIENIHALDTHIRQSGQKDFVLHYSKGSSAKATDFQPLETTLSPAADVKLAPVGGRPSDGAFPYFNLESPEQGIILAIGWPGQWAARFTHEQDQQLRLQAGQETTHFKLLPGEEVRTPLIVMQFYHGDWISAQNTWRRWMIAHNLPRPGGHLPTPLLAGGSCPYFGPFIGNNEENQELFIRRYQEEGIKLDYWWIDAGWYPNNGKWTDTGTWELDTKRFPRGLKAVSDYAHARGSKLIVWFEPERVTPNTWLYDKHPEWLLKVPPTPGFKPSQMSWRLLNLGNPAALEWVTNHVDKIITDQHIDLYRQDFNMEALPFWRAADAEDRQGITENHYVTGYLAYWDALRSRHPDLLIDNCSSGGRRLDLESLRRSVPLWRSDYLIEPIGMQNQTYGISLWFPYEGLASQISETGAGKKTIDTYAFRSDMYSSIHAHWDVRRTDIDYARLRELVHQWRTVVPNYMGDYYPITPFDPSDKAWIAWQFDRPAENQGMVQAFRRPGSTQESATLKLRGLDPKAHYTVTNFDTAKHDVKTGQDLMEHGLDVVLSERPGSLLLTYKRMGE